MSIEDIVTVNITAQTSTVSRAGFGVPLIATYHTVFAGRSQAFADLTEMVDAGFAVGEVTYRAAAAAFAQEPRPSSVKIGRRALPMTQSLTFTPTDVTEGLVYTMAFVRPDGTTASASYTVAALDAVADIIDGLLIAIAAISPALAMTATDNTTDFDLDADNPGELFDVVVSRELEVKDNTTDPGIATDLAAIRAADGDWYGLALDSNSSAEVVAAAAWAETETVLFGANTSDADAKSALTTDVMSILQLAAYARTFVIWSGSVLSNAGAAWLGKQLPTDPGTTTWAFKTLAGLTVDSLTSAERAFIEGKNGNTYTRVAGRNITRQGVTAAGEFIDVTRYVDFLDARIGERVFLLMVNLPKIPYTDASVDLFRSEILAQLTSGIPQAIADDPAPTCTAPLVANVATADRAGRILPDIKFTARIAGSIHKVQINGTLTV